MGLAFFIYFFLLLMMVGFAIYKAKSINLRNEKYWNYKTIIPIVIASLILGMRYDVGVDYLNYLEYFNASYQYGFIELERLEIGFLYLIKVLNYINAHFSFLFIFSALITLVFLYKGIKPLNKFLPYLIFYYFTCGLIFHSNNIIRHMIAFSILIYALEFIKEKQFVRYVIAIALAAAFHKSILIFLPFYFILNRDIFKNLIFQYISLIVFAFLGTQIFELLLNYFSGLFTYLGYTHYLENADQYIRINNLNSRTGFGLLNFGVLIINLVIVYYSVEIKKTYKDSNIVLYYNLFIIGQLLFSLVVGNLIFERLVYHFYFFRFIIYAIATYYFLHYKPINIIKILIACSMILIFLSSFIIAIITSESKCSPFQFFFMS